jgi:hypothetical protein
MMMTRQAGHGNHGYRGKLYQDELARTELPREISKENQSPSAESPAAGRRASKTWILLIENRCSCDT